MAAYTSAASLLIFLIASILSTVDALNIGLHADAGLSLFKQCSRTCESMFCQAPPFLRYGKYCGLLYSGCPGEKPCDRLDACCMNHDQCISKMGSLAGVPFCNTTTTRILVYNGTIPTPLIMHVVPAFNDAPTAHKFNGNITALVK